MLRYATVALLLAAAPPPPVVSAANLLSRNLAARGGVAALSSLTSVEFKGQYIAPGDFKLTYHEIRSRAPGGDRVRDDLSIQGLTVVQAYDGSGAWKINPFQGRKDPERMSADESRAQADAALVDGPLITAMKDGSTVRYLGREDYEGTLAYKIDVRQRDGDEYVYLLDPDSFLEIRATETRLIRGARTVTEYEFGEYQKVGGAYFPMAIDSWQPTSPNQRSRIIIAQASANPTIDPGIFVAPGSPNGAAKVPIDAAAAPSASQPNSSAPTSPKTR